MESDISSSWSDMPDNTSEFDYDSDRELVQFILSHLDMNTLDSMWLSWCVHIYWVDIIIII